MTPEKSLRFRNSQDITRRNLLRASIAASFLDSSTQTGTSLVIRITDRKILHIENAEFASGALLPPASTIKPFTILALFEAGKLRATDDFVCSRRLTINGHSLNCIHPPAPVPMNPSRALSYSCNGAIAHFALGFEPDELPQALTRYGFTSATGAFKLPEATGQVRHNTSHSMCQLQALGDEGILITPLELLFAYTRLPARLRDRKYFSILDGLEGAVEFGTAQAAKVRGLGIAGKTGSIVLNSGSPAAWFAGFAPSRSPQVAVVVFTAGHSGGSDAAPIARQLLKTYVRTA